MSQKKVVKRARGSLSKNEQKVLYALIRYPTYSDTDLAEELDLAQSTVTTIRHRLCESGAYKDLWIPMLNRSGCELLVLIHTNFNPVIPVEERAPKTRKTIEIFDEIFFSIGETQKGFSMSMAKDYTAVGKINDVRTQTFAGMDLLEREYPREIIFPFELTTIHRFFNFAPYLEKHLGLGEGWGDNQEIEFPKEPAKLTDTDRKVYMALVDNPEDRDGEIGKRLDMSRHTVALHRKRLEGEHIVRARIPDMKLVGANIMVFHHVKFNPYHDLATSVDKELAPLLSPYAVFMVSRKYEMLRICIYPSYDMYKKDKNHMMSYLHKRNLLAEYPLSRLFVLDDSIIIKDFSFAPLVHKILERDGEDAK